jgi:hypothetical protein
MEKLDQSLLQRLTPLFEETLKRLAGAGGDEA